MCCRTALLYRPSVTRAGKLAGELGFEPRRSVLETDSLAIELTPPGLAGRGMNLGVLLLPVPSSLFPAGTYFVSLWSVCLRQVLQNLENSSRPVVVFLFFVVE